MQKATAIAIQNDIAAAMAAIEAKYNLKLARNKGIFNEFGYKATIEFGDKEVVGNTNPKYIQDIERYGWSFDINRDKLNKKFNYCGKVYILEGMKRAKVVGKCVIDSKNYLIPAEKVVWC